MGSGSSGAASGAGGVVGGVFDIMALSGQRQAARDQAVTENASLLQQQQIAKAQAADALSRGSRAAGLARIKGSQVIGQQQAALGASGVDASSGSPLKMMADTRLMSEADVATIKANAAKEAWGYETEAAKYGIQAYLRRKAAANQESAYDSQIAGAGVKTASSGVKAVMSLGMGA